MGPLGPTLIQQYAVQVISKIQPQNLVKMVRTFGLQFRQALIFDRVKEELTNFWVKEAKKGRSIEEFARSWNDCFQWF